MVPLHIPLVGRALSAASHSSCIPPGALGFIHTYLCSRKVPLELPNIQSLDGHSSSAGRRTLDPNDNEAGVCGPTVLDWSRGMPQTTRRALLGSALGCCEVGRVGTGETLLGFVYI